MSLERTCSEVDLAGYLSPVSDQAAFVLPVFRSRGANCFFIQEIEIDGTVGGFRECFPRDLTEVRADEPVRVRVGSLALWGFVESGGEQHFSSKADLQQWLKPRLSSVEQPFLRLQIAQFCDAESELLETWQSVFRHIAGRSPTSAKAWRDVVIMPSNIRSAVQYAFIAHGLDGAMAGLDQCIEVSIENNIVNVMLNGDLFNAFQNSRAARQTLNEKTEIVRRAFGFAGGPVNLTEIKDGIGRNQESVGDVVGDPVIFSIGGMASRITHLIFPDQKRRGHSYHSQTDGEHILVYKNGLVIGEGTSFDVESLAQAITGSNDVLVLFQLASATPRVLEAAKRLTIALREKMFKVVAVIPHLPEPASPNADIAGYGIHSLRELFDAVWLLSDRSPSTQQSIPYGPSRSLAAAASHFAWLLSSVNQRRGAWQASFSQPGSAAAISIIGSAAGDRLAPRLVEHAIMRMTHHSLDFSSSRAAVVSFDRKIRFSEKSIKNVIARDASNAAISIETKNEIIGKQKVAVALIGVDFRNVSSRSFNYFCRNQLSKMGWTVDSIQNGDADLIASLGNLIFLPIECKLHGGRQGELSSSKQKKTEQEYDSVLITNAMIRRMFFARSVLHGVVPIHYSRIGALEGIYRRRYSDVIRTLDRAGPAVAADLLLPAAIDFLRKKGSYFLGLTSSPISSSYLKGAVMTNVNVTSASVRVKLTVHIDQPNQNSGFRSGNPDIDLILDRDGWHIYSDEN